MEDDCTDSLHRCEHREGILARIELKAQYLLSVSVHCAVHEPPRKRECVDENALLIFPDHQEAEQPDEDHVYHVSIYAGFVADSVYDLAHEKRTDHLTKTKNAQS